jgi:dTDP-4-amino-4,6-dideoxygalactose transaminase
MFAAPQPRFRFYNGFRNFRIAAQDTALLRVYGGGAVEEAEAAVTRWLPAGDGVITAQGRYAMFLGLKQLIRPGQNVVMSPYTLYDVVNMVIAAGGIPRFADIDAETCNLSPKAAEEAIDPNTGAVIVTHLHGCVSGMDRILDICKGAGVPLLEDACQAFGASWNGKRAGTIGKMGFFSFGRAKNINAFLGGMVVSDDIDIVRRIRASVETLPKEDGRRLAGRVGHCLLGQVLTSPLPFSAFTYWILRDGVLKGRESINKQFNTESSPALRRRIPASYERRISQMQARLVLDQLPRVDEYSAHRISLAGIYDEGLRGIPGILRPPLRSDRSHIYLSYAIQVEDRAALQAFMVRNYRDLVIQHIGNTADYPCFQEFHRDCPIARRTARSVLLLPTYPSYRPEQAVRNVEVIRKFYRNHIIRPSHHPPSAIASREIHAPGA